MKQTLLSLLAVGAIVMPAAATDFMAPAAANAPVDPDSTGFTFTDVKIVRTTPVKDQNKSGTCWSFSGTSFLEEEILRKGGPELDLSEMWVVRNCYSDKADKYMLMDGKINFAQGGALGDVLYSYDKFGVVPEDVYSGLQYGEDKHAHYELAAALEGYLKGVTDGKGQSLKKYTTAWKPGFEGILDAYFGKMPETFTYNGKTYTPQSFAKELGLNMDDYISITSWTHHPFYKAFPLEIADNWLWHDSMNVPMEDMEAIVDNALNNGYTVAWAADVSEPGFKWYNGYALLPEEKSAADMDGSELARWVKLSDKDREAEKYDIKGPVKEKTVTQENRQEGFMNHETTDDHGMVIVGIAKDQEGNKYYKVKNSWDTNQLYDGYFYLSMPYFNAKTISFVVNKEAIPEKIAKKFN